LKKKLVYFAVILSFLSFSYYVLGHSIGKTDNYLIDKIKIIVPNEIKQFLKDTLFFSQNQKILEQQFVEKIEEQD